MEVLAHISARSSRQGDERYRKQAEAYGSFQAQTSTRGEQESFDTDPVADGAGQSADAGVTTFLVDTQQAVALLESQVITSSLLQDLHLQDTDFSNDLDRRETTACASRDVAEALAPSPPAGSVPISELLPAQLIEAPPVTARLRSSVSSTWSDAIGCTEMPSTYEISAVSSSQDLPPPADHSGGSPSPAGALMPTVWGNSQPQELEHPALQSFVDADPGPPEPTTQIYAPEPDVTTQSDDPVPTTSGFPRSADDLPPSSKRKSPPPADDAGIEASKRSKALAEPAPTSPAAETTIVAEGTLALARTVPEAPGKPLMELADVPEMFRAPSLSAGMRPFPTTFVEGIFITLKEQANLSSRFKADFTREIDYCERGHWYFALPLAYDDKYWTEHYARSMWTVLYRVIRSGSAGWNIWVDRTLATEEQGEIVRVFCWGDVVEHVYLLLYTASHSRIKRFGPVWRDVGGNAVVTLKR